MYVCMSMCVCTGVFVAVAAVLRAPRGGQPGGVGVGELVVEGGGAGDGVLQPVSRAGVGVREGAVSAGRRVVVHGVTIRRRPSSSAAIEMCSSAAIEMCLSVDCD